MRYFIILLLAIPVISLSMERPADSKLQEAAIDAINEEDLTKIDNVITLLYDQVDRPFIGHKTLLNLAVELNKPIAVYYLITQKHAKVTVRDRNINADNIAAEASRRYRMIRDYQQSAQYATDTPEQRSQEQTRISKLPSDAGMIHNILSQH